MAIDVLVSTWATIGAVFVTWAVLWTLNCLIIALLDAAVIVWSACENAIPILGVAVVDTLLNLFSMILSTVAWSRIISWTKV